MRAAGPRRTQAAERTRGPVFAVIVASRRPALLNPSRRFACRCAAVTHANCGRLGAVLQAYRCTEINLFSSSLQFHVPGGLFPFLHPRARENARIVTAAKRCLSVNLCDKHYPKLA